MKGAGGGRRETGDFKSFPRPASRAPRPQLEVLF